MNWEEKKRDCKWIEMTCKSSQGSAGEYVVCARVGASVHDGALSETFEFEAVL